LVIFSYFKKWFAEKTLFIDFQVGKLSNGYLMVEAIDYSDLSFNCSLNQTIFLFKLKNFIKNNFGPFKSQIFGIYVACILSLRLFKLYVPAFFAATGA